MIADVLLCVLALGFPHPGAQDEPEVPKYPYELIPVDAIRGHLMEGEFREPAGIFYDRRVNELLVADSKNNLIGMFDPEGIPLFAFGGINMLSDPRSVAVDAEGSVYVLASQRKVHPFSYRGEPLPPLRFNYPNDGAVEAGTATVAAFTIDHEGNWYVADLDPPQVLVYDRELNLKFAIRPAAKDLSFGAITSIAVSRDGLIAVLDFEKTPVQIFDAEGRYRNSFGRRDSSLGGFSAPVAVEFDDEGYLYIVDMLRHDVKIFTVGGLFLNHFGGWFANSNGRAPGEMLYPVGIAITPAAGPIYVSERFGNRVQIFKRVVPEPAASATPRLRIPPVGGGNGGGN